MNDNLPVKRIFHVQTEWGKAIIDADSFKGFSMGSTHPNPTAVYACVNTSDGIAELLTTLHWEAAMDLVRLIAESRRRERESNG